MGSVWLADHLTLEVPCAVKFISEESVRDPRYRAQFHLEARAIAQVQSAHVVRVLDHDTCDQGPYIAMELLVGEHLHARLNRVERLGARATYQVVSQVARGLSRVHAAGIVHYDLKPENVFFAREGEGEIVKLYDFGVARLTEFSLGEPSIPRTGMLIGTPEYMSPEQARGLREVDYRADLWSLAVIAYQCMTGRLPFKGSSLIELLDGITSGSIPVPSDVAEDVSPDFDWWWARATSRNIDGRYQTARHLAEALGEALGVTGPEEPDSQPVGGAGAVAARDPSPPNRSISASTHASGLAVRRVRPRNLLAAAALTIAVISLGRWIAESNASLTHASVTGPAAAASTTRPLDSAAPVRLVAQESVRSSDEPRTATRGAASTPDPSVRAVAPPGPRRSNRPFAVKHAKEVTEVDFGI
jgi:serine/threonine protein kinase